MNPNNQENQESAPSDNANNKTTNNIATFGGGCFWCLEAVFELIPGVLSVKSGYSGGTVPNPTYEQVCTGLTNHAEVIQIRFDPIKADYRYLLQIFFAFHDPTTKNRQGNDVGTQYRSIIFYHDEEQKKIAEEVMQSNEIIMVWGKNIVTELEPLSIFYPAEDYHQGYFRNHPSQGYCQVAIAPKVAKLRKYYLSVNPKEKIQ